MRKRTSQIVATVGLALFWSGAARGQHDPAQHGSPEMSDEQIVASAMRAAPPAVAKGATVIVVGEGGKARVVRQGDNGFTCLADNPNTPGPDPMCADANAMVWVQAWLEHKDPPTDKIGFMYMLEGGTDASNTDPFAAAPTADNHWVETGPHVMLVGSPKMLAAYPRSADPDTSQPYVMWPGTPYEHLMIPVQ